MADLDFLDEQALAAIFAANNLKPTTNHTLGEWAAGMRAALPKFGVDNPRRVAAFLGQTLLESGGFRHLEENLHYSSQGLQKTFRLSEEEANAIAGDPEKIANKVYGEGHRAQGLGNTQAGDGYLYRGRGLIQLTGRSNYEQCSAALFKQGLTPAEDAITRNPDLLMTDASLALASAAWFWSSRSHDLNALADQCSGAATVEPAFHQLTHQINTAELDVDRRYAIFKSALGQFSHLSGAPAPVPPIVVNAPSVPPPQAPPEPQAQQPAPQQPAPQQPAPQQPAPKPVGGSVLTAILAFLLGALAFIKAGIANIGAAIDKLRADVEAQYHVDPLWIAAGLFALAILFIIIVRVEHSRRLKRADT